MSLANIPGLGNFPPIREDLKTLSVTLRHFVIVSHAVPAIRVRALVPSHFALDTLKIGGETCAIVQSTVAYNDDLHYTPLAKPSLDFWSATFRILTRAPLREDTSSDAPGAPGQRMLRTDPAAWLVRSFLGARAAWALQRAVAANAQHAELNVIQRGDYDALYVDVQPEDKTLATQLSVRAVVDELPVAPFASWQKMTQFLTARPQGYYDMPAFAGRENIGFVGMDHPPLEPRNAEAISGGEVREVQLGVWEQLGILSPDEMRQPFSVLIQPELAVVIQPPKLLRHGAGTDAPPA